MQRKRGELVPIGEAFGGLDGPVKALRETSPQAAAVFTQADQVHQLVGAREADPEPKHREPGFPFWPWHGHRIHPRCAEYHVFSR